MKIYGPFALTPGMIQLMVTRTQPGVGLLCNDAGSIEIVTRSDHDIAETLLQWVHRHAFFYFCYTLTGAEAERTQEQLSQRLGFASSDQVVGGDPRKLAKLIQLEPSQQDDKGKKINKDHTPHACHYSWPWYRSEVD